MRGGPDERAGSLALVGRERLDGCTDARGELGDVAQTLALGAQALLGVRLEPLGVLDQRAQLGDAGFGVRGVRGELLVPTRVPRAARATHAAGRHGDAAGRRPTKASSTSSWYAGRASRRCSNWPDIATSRSASAATSSRATLRPHA